MAGITQQNQVFEAESGPAAELRAYKSNIQGLDQIIAISEDSLNSMLSARFNSALKRKKDKRLREFKHAIKDYGEINAALSAPRIQMAVPESPESVYFFLNFAKDSSFLYWSGFGPQAKKKTQRLDGWSVAFKTTFGLSKLAQVPESIASQITLLKPGSYSASQLVLGFSAAATAELVWSASVCPGMNENPDLKFASQNVFEEWMKLYIRWLSTGPFSVLGYAIKVEEKLPTMDVGAPLFPPTAVKCRTQEYVPCTEDFKKLSQGRGGLDAFIFAEMTENRPFPPIPYNPSAAGNWIIGGVDASLTMSRRVFWDRYLLDRFQLLNIQCMDLANNSLYWVGGQAASAFITRPWRLSTAPKPTSAPWTMSDYGARYKWIGERKGDGSDIFVENLDVNTTIENCMEWTPGSNSATFKVKIELNWVYPQKVGLLNASLEGSSKFSWSVGLKLITIKDGALEVGLDYLYPHVSVDLNTPNVVAAIVVDKVGVKNECEKLARAFMEQNVGDLSSIKRDMANTLNGQSKLVFPGGGDFFMKNPKFNNAGDLLMELSFVAKEIVVDDDFHLQVSAPGHIQLNGSWLAAADDGRVAFVSDQKSATLFQIDDGILVIDQAGRPTGSRALNVTMESISEVQDIALFDPESFKELIRTPAHAVPLEVSTTGSQFTYSIDGGLIWRGDFVLAAGETEKRLQLFMGDTDEPGPYEVFSLLAIY